MPKHEFYKQLTSQDFNKNSLDLVIMPVEQERLTKLVFAADPNTGNPSSDVAYMLKGSDPSFKQYIKDNLMSGSIASSALADSAEEASELVHKNLMTTNQYNEMVIGYVKEKFSKKND